MRNVIAHLGKGWIHFFQRQMGDWCDCLTDNHVFSMGYFSPMGDDESLRKLLEKKGNHVNCWVPFEDEATLYLLGIPYGDESFTMPVQVCDQEKGMLSFKPEKGETFVTGFTAWQESWQKAFPDSIIEEVRSEYDMPDFIKVRTVERGELSLPVTQRIQRYRRGNEILAGDLIVCDVIVLDGEPVTITQVTRDKPITQSDEELIRSIFGDEDSFLP
jgi:hypothetical protein